MLLSLLAALTLQPAADLPAPTEEMRGTYYAPPGQSSGAAAYAPAKAESAGVFGLASHLNSVEEALTQCETMRAEMTSLISSDFGSYSVHPKWLKAYQTCILTRDKEIKALGELIQRRKPELLEGLNSDQAVRITDIIARLEVYQTRIKREVSAEVGRQKGLIELFNEGGGFGDQPATYEVPADTAPASITPTAE